MAREVRVRVRVREQNKKGVQNVSSWGMRFFPMLVTARSCGH